MAKVSIEGVGGYSHHYPRLAVIVTVHAGDKDNAMAAAWHCPLSFKPPLYGVSISPRRFTHDLIVEAGEFGVNFVPMEKAELIASVGGSSGREVDKFHRYQIAKEKSLKTSAPLLAEAYACYECRLVAHQTYGDHVWFVGQVVASHFEQDCFTSEQLLNLERVAPALYLSGELYTYPAKDNIRHLDRKVYGERALH